MIIGLMVIAPIVSILIDLLITTDSTPLIYVIGTWFVFWAIGIRLFTAGIRQIIQPRLTAEGILGIKDKMSWQLVRELGFANLGIGLIAILSLWVPEWRLAGAIAGGIFFLAAGIEHIRKKERNFEENVALGSDLLIGVIALIFVLWSLFKI